MRESVPDDPEISLRDIFEALIRQRKLIVAFTAGTVVVGLLYAIFTTPLYTASVTVQPVSEQKPGGLAGLAAQFGSVASLAGINLPSAGAEAVEYIAILKSREFGERFIREQQVKPHLFRDKWDARAGAWIGGGREGGGLLSGLKRSILATLAALSDDEGWSGEPREAEPSMWVAYQMFNDQIRRIQEDPQTGLVTVLFEYRNPRLAAQWANAYVAMANEEIRANAIEEASRALEYLNREVERTTAVGLRETIYKLVEAQLERIMLANAREDYAFKVIDKAVEPERRSHPKRALIIALSLVLGLILGIFAALARDAWKGSFRQTT